MNITLEINKENTYLISDNKDSLFILGIGNTNYTIHRDADEIAQYYSEYEPKTVHSVHYMRLPFLKIIDDIKFKESVIIDNIIYQIKDAFIGIPNIISMRKGKREYKPLIDGGTIENINSELRFVLVVE